MPDLPASPAHPPLRLHEPAPAFRARTTQGELALEDYRGRWVLLFSHPADFTPVCTSEFIAFARAQARFDALDCALLALSVDGLFSHLAWLRDIQARFGVTIGFPVIEDPSMAAENAKFLASMGGRGKAYPETRDKGDSRPAGKQDPCLEAARMMFGRK